MCNLPKNSCLRCEWMQRTWGRRLHAMTQDGKIKKLDVREELDQRCGAILVANKSEPPLRDSGRFTIHGSRYLIQRSLLPNPNVGKRIKDVSHCVEWEIGDDRQAGTAHQRHSDDPLG